MIWLQKPTYMNKSYRNMIFFTKPAVSKPLNSKAFNENQQIITFNNLSLDEKTIICVIPKSSTSHHNKSYDYENDKKC